MYHPHKINQKPLRIVLFANALFSGLSGMTLVLMPEQISQFLDISGQSLLLATMGLGLILFAIDLSHQISQSRMATWRALYASIGDFTWVLGSLMLLILKHQNFSQSALLLISGIAILVGVLGSFQIWGIRLYHQLANTQRYRHCLSVEVPVPAAAMWEIIGDLGQIQQYMPSLKHSELLNNSQPGVEAIRHCINNKNQAWSEVCIAFEPGKSFDMRFLSEEPGFPFPAKEMLGGWEVFNQSPTSSQVRIWWELVPKSDWLAPLLMPVLAFQADRDFVRIVQVMAEQALNKDTKQVLQKPVKAHLLPTLC